MKINTPNNDDCPNCHELESTECIVEEQSVASLGLPAGSRLNTIIKYLDNKIKAFSSKFTKVIYNTTPIWDTGVSIFSYTSDSKGLYPFEMKIPLFLNGKECFEYDEEVITEYIDEPAYVMFFNHTHCGGNFIGSDDTIQITHISGVALSTPLVVKAPGDDSFAFTNDILQTLLSEINTLTTSTFTDIVTDTTLTVNNDVGLGLVPTAGAGATFLGDLTFTYEHLDVSLVLVDTIVENILSRNVDGFGIITTTVENFSVEAVMGNMTFYDASLVEVTDQIEIDNLIQLIVEEVVRPICCPDCGGGDFTYTGADVDCGALNLATAGDSIEDILTKVCARIDTIGQFFNIVLPNDDGDIDNLFINGSAGSTSVTNDINFWADRIGCNDDITITINSVDGITFFAGASFITVLSDSSFLISEFEHPVGLVAGNYNATLTWSSCGVDKVQNITFSLS